MSEAKEGYRGTRNQMELDEFMERLRELNKYLIVSVGEQPEPPAAADMLKPILELGEIRLDDMIDYAIFTNPWHDELESDTAKVNVYVSGHLGERIKETEDGRFYLTEAGRDEYEHIVALDRKNNERTPHLKTISENIRSQKLE